MWHEYAFTPLYDPNMPESIPKRIIVRQMLANLLGVLGTGLRWLAVVNLWLVVLPYIVYWLTRFYFWSGQSFVPNDSVAATVALYSGDTDATNATMQANSAGAVITAGSRFVDHASWREWYWQSATTTPSARLHRIRVF
ncbi:hypothetical protein DL89DRAFT_94447 [Linderina pennispora]|uniref:RING-type E3 ubiquitin transferase n=1 Tax=Linderina pennispora TaxID=61395 RepID=A0A1Y1VQV9_9FUNG|nr:uncharacterized protein DL89DRAFT_94447 [Linderina pennispora]ORX63416.1 hypothetical protein DL89DRAFT_94447 [Linderina pennispora]